MKLIFCKKCQDVFKLHKIDRKCVCGLSSGYYEQDGLNAVISGKFAIPLGFGNHSFAQSILGGSRNFEAFIIPENAKTIRRGER